MTRLDLDQDVAALTVALCDIESVSGNERRLAEAIELALREVPHLTVDRDGDAVVARTNLGRPERVVLAGHIDTVPLGDNLPCRVVDGRIHGCGTTDMKSGVAVQLRLAKHLAEPNRDVTYVFYDHEEVEADKNGLRPGRAQPPGLAGRRLRRADGADQRHRRGRLPGHAARRRRAARPPRATRPGPGWAATRSTRPATVLQRLAAYEAAEVEIDGLHLPRGPQRGRHHRGSGRQRHPGRVPGHRQLPVRAGQERGPGSRGRTPGARRASRSRSPTPPPARCPACRTRPRRRSWPMVGREPLPKFGWTDVARFSALGVPAVNYGPGDPSVAHQREEYCDIAPILECEQKMRAWLGA